MLYVDWSDEEHMFVVTDGVYIWRLDDTYEGALVKLNQMEDNVNCL